jgi:hypothetical protein
MLRNTCTEVLEHLRRRAQTKGSVHGYQLRRRQHKIFSPDINELWQEGTFAIVNSCVSSRKLPALTEGSSID